MLYFASFASSCVSRVSSHCAFLSPTFFLVSISWVKNYFLWVFRGPQIFSQGYFFESEIIFLRVFHVIFITNITAVHIHLARPLKLTSHSILHYLWSANISKSFSQLCQYGFYLFSIFIFLPVGKVWYYPALLASWFIHFNINAYYLCLMLTHFTAKTF